MFLDFLRRRPPQARLDAERLHAAIVAAARRPALYLALGAPDTLPGRFELIVLHAALVLRRLRAEDAAAQKDVAQELSDEIFRKLDANLREIGVGDLTVPKRMKSMASAFYDGARAYDAALDAQDEAALAAALGRTVYAGTEFSDFDARGRLAAYAARADVALARQAPAALVADGPDFPPIEETGA